METVNQKISRGRELCDREVSNKSDLKILERNFEGFSMNSYLFSLPVVEIKSANNSLEKIR
jgi:hypothetical protein